MGDETQSALDARIEAGTLKQWLNTINAIVDEHRHHVTGTGFRASAIDPSNAAMVRTTLGGNAFEDFAGGTALVGMPTESVLNALSRASAGDIVRLHVTDNHRLHIEYGGVSIKRGLIDPDVIRQEPDTPDLQYTGTVKIDTDHLQSAAWTMGMVNDRVDIIFDPDVGVVFKTRGDTDDARYEVGLDQLGDGSEIDSRSTSLFSLDFFELIVNALPDGTVEFSVGNEFPMEISAELTDSSRAVFHLAPRIKKE